MIDRDTTTIVSPYFRLIVWICAQQTGLPSRYDEGERKKRRKKWLDTCDIFLGIDIFSITDVLYCLFFLDNLIWVIAFIEYQSHLLIIFTLLGPEFLKCRYPFRVFDIE